VFEKRKPAPPSKPKAPPLDAAKRAELFEFLKKTPYGVVSTVHKDGSPESALISLAVTPELEVVFETLNTARKYLNAMRDPRVAVAIGGRGDKTVQIEGLADEPVEEDLERLKAAYYAECSFNEGHRGWPGMTYLRVKPTWIRYSNYALPWSVEEYSVPA